MYDVNPVETSRPIIEVSLIAEYFASVFVVTIFDTLVPPGIKTIERVAVPPK